MSEVVAVRGVTRRFGREPHVVTALNGITIAFRAGTMTAVIGASGSGKTTLLHLLVGWDEPDDGEVIRAEPTLDWTRVAVIPQNIGLIEELTVGENLSLPGRLNGAPPTSLVGPSASLGIDHLTNRMPAELSLGEQQRVAVLRASLGSPALLVADEPTAHQDEANADRVLSVLQAKADEGVAVVVSTHDRRLLAAFDRQVHLDLGEIVSAD